MTNNGGSEAAMKKQTPKKSEIFLLLALRQAARFSSAADAAEVEEQAPPEDESREEIFTTFAEQLPAHDAERFERLRLNYQNKSDDEKRKWRERVAASIGASAEFSIDENIHRSHVDAALARENPAIQKIVRATLSTSYRNDLETDSLNKEFKTARVKTTARIALEKTVCKTFAAQFVRLKDLREAKAFDRLSGAEIARLARLAGIREVAFACAGIKEIEAVGAFLRRFAPEDGRAVAAQLSGLPQTSVERLAFAESLVESALEIESQPSSAMLDWLGVRLIGILLCESEEENEKSAARLAYAEQKLPRETAPKLSELIETECRKTPAALKEKIGAEIEKLAETIAASSAGNN